MAVRPDQRRRDGSRPPDRLPLVPCRSSRSYNVDHVRLPDERARLGADLRAPRGRRIYPGERWRNGRRRRLQHLRGPGERRQPPLRQPRSPAPDQGEEPGHADRRRRLPGPEGPRRDRQEGALGRRRLRHAQHRFAAGAARTRPAQRERPGRDPRVARGLPVDAADPARVDLRRLGVDLGRLQQHLHVLHRAEPARHREGPPPGRRPGRGAGARRRGRPRGHAARAERQLLRRRVRRPARVRQAAAGAAARSTGWSGSGSPARTRRTSPTT